jgi:hypothetical protein
MTGEDEDNAFPIHVPIRLSGGCALNIADAHIELRGTCGSCKQYVPGEPVGRGSCASSTTMLDPEKDYCSAWAIRPMNNA